MIDIRVKMARGNLKRCAQEMKDIYDYVLEQVKDDSQIPAEEDIIQCQEMMDEVFVRLAQAATTLRNSVPAEETVANEDEEETEEGYYQKEIKTD